MRTIPEKFKRDYESSDSNRKIQEAYKAMLMNEARGTLDKEAARELKIFLDNDAQLYKQSTLPFIKNYITKVAQGKFNKKMAVKGIANNLMKFAAQKYAKDYSSGDDWHSMFSTATREAAAEEWVEEWFDEAELGNYDDMLPKKYTANGGTKGTDWKKLRK
jgi:hypothetical protein